MDFAFYWEIRNRNPDFPIESILRKGLRFVEIRFWISCFIGKSEIQISQSKAPLDGELFLLPLPRFSLDGAILNRDLVVGTFAVIHRLIRLNRDLA